MPLKRFLRVEQRGPKLRTHGGEMVLEKVVAQGLA